jgi:hypothetical protein
MAHTDSSAIPHPAERATVAGPGVSTVQTRSSTPILTAPARYVLLCLAHQLTGYTIKAMQRKIERGDWVEGQVWRRAPDGRILIDMEGYRRWVEKR